VRRVIDYIDTSSVALSEHPVFVRLRDSSIDARERLRFVPSTAHFIMTFADLCSFFLPVEPPTDRFDELANMNLSEEGDHWKWFLADLSSLELDPTMRLTDAMRLLWSDATSKTRRLSYEICRLSAGLNSIHRLVLVLSIEATGRVALESAAPAGREVASLLGKKLVYFGAQHLDSEHGHTLSEDQVRGELASLELDAPTCEQLEAQVDRVFGYFREMLDDAFRFSVGVDR
jgi:hypothetical protein